MASVAKRQFGKLWHWPTPADFLSTEELFFLCSPTASEQIVGGKFLFETKIRRRIRMTNLKDLCPTSLMSNNVGKPCQASTAYFTSCALYVLRRNFVRHNESPGRQIQMRETKRIQIKNIGLSTEIQLRFNGLWSAN